MTNRASGVLLVQLLPNGGYALSLSEPADAATDRLLKHRLPCLQPFLNLAVAEFTRLGHSQARFAVQLHDEDPDQPCFRFDAPLEPDGKGPLIPDPYVLGSQGYANLRRQFAAQPLPPWEQRLPVAIWRGSSTGLHTLRADNLKENPRYRLCQASLHHGAWLDARFTAVVQCPDASAQHVVATALQHQGLLAPRMSPWHLALHRWIVEIDGNVNSWGLLWKLLSGSCVIRITSQRRQWYHHLLEPWVHVVPVSADLSDLASVLAWCQSHPQACAAIATAGQRLAAAVISRLKTDQQEALAAYATKLERICAA